MRNNLIGLVLAGCLANILTPNLAVAQCPPGTPIYIDPRLAPHRPQIGREQFVAIMANPMISDEEKKSYSDLYNNQNQPIQLPFRNGIVLISPKNPCIQQYLGN
jgi:hypothetical protein